MDDWVSYTWIPVNNFNKIKMTIKKIAKKVTSTKWYDAPSNTSHKYIHMHVYKCIANAESIIQNSRWWWCELWNTKIVATSKVLKKPNRIGTDSKHSAVALFLSNFIFFPSFLCLSRCHHSEYISAIRGNSTIKHDLHTKQKRRMALFLCQYFEWRHGCRGQIVGK